jgi:hypothetical protein
MSSTPLGFPRQKIPKTSTGKFTEEFLFLFILEKLWKVIASKYYIDILEMWIVKI